ncbi:MAG: hypothetical protein HYZ28_22995 [Myxococcales bacterium]|nr:hypothetical protein [Myxococcales bacterium]
MDPTTPSPRFQAPWLLGVAALALAACLVEDGGPDGGRRRDDSEGLGDASTLRSSSPYDAGEDAGEAAVEACDGWDNNGNGLVDEGTGGERCTTSAGEEGTLICVQGGLKCVRCSPGQQKNEPCGCGIDRTDTCNETGRWVFGSCDGCPASYTPSGCDKVGACTPGDVEYRPCDMCPADGGACGTRCVGARWMCSNSCAWVQAAPCEVLSQPECTADQVFEEPCGACGKRQVVCDGCFWTRKPCRDQGACVPGRIRDVPCLSGACLPGHVATSTCTEQCQWGATSACRGCTLSTPAQETTEYCVAGHPLCGAKLTRTQCVGEPTDSCGPGGGPLEGQLTTTTVKDECPLVECNPGDVVDLGACQCPTYRRSKTCGADCRFQLTECPTPVCVLGQLRTVACTQYDNASRTEKCESCGWAAAGGCAGNVSGLPCQCYPGQAQTLLRSCGPSNGCMRQQVTRTCVDCRWEETVGACNQPPPCTTADNSVTQVSCGANTCGKTFTRTTTCDLTTTCSLLVSDDRSSCPPCQQGQTRQTSCTTGTGACGTQTSTCDATCSWGAPSACQASPSSCTPGTTKTESCTTSASLYCGVPGSRTLKCAANGCGWNPITDCLPTDPSRCKKGDSQAVGTCSCGTPDVRTCDSTCQWGPSSCSPACTAGTVMSQTCVATDTCNAAGHKRVKCTGCAWVDDGPCVPDDASRCKPGDTKTVVCQDLGTKTLTCTASCSWPTCQ